MKYVFKHPCGTELTVTADTLQSANQRACDALLHDGAMSLTDALRWLKSTTVKVTLTVTCYCFFCLKKFEGRNLATRYCSKKCNVEFNKALQRKHREQVEAIRHTDVHRRKDGQIDDLSLSDGSDRDHIQL